MMEKKSEQITWVSTTEEHQWVENEKLSVSSVREKSEDKDKMGQTEQKYYVKVDQEVGYQKLEKHPWGGCFNERGYRAMEKLSEEEKNKIIHALFGQEGLALSAARTPLGSSDYAIESYSYDETEGDYECKDFSTSRDDTYLIPYIKRALECNPDLYLWASPWSPPSWIKKNKALVGGEIEDTHDNFKAYAKYFVKYIQEYKEKGIKVQMVMPQNEPTMNTAYASCLWSGEQLNTFVRDYLAPAFLKEKIDTKIWLGTFTDSDSSLVDPTLSDPVTKSMIEGVGFQWWGKQKASMIYRENTGLKLMQSETICGNGENNWQYAQEQFDLIKGYMEAGVNAYMLWNMVLDEKGENTAPNPWHQNSPIIVQSQDGQVIYNPQYYMMKHFSHFVQGNARRIKTSSFGVDAIAFQNSDGENILIVKNGNEDSRKVCIDFNKRTVEVELLPHSFHTFIAAGEIKTDMDSSFTQEISSEPQELWIKLIHKDSGLALAVKNASYTNGEELVLYDNQGTADQIWKLDNQTNRDEIGKETYKMINKHSLRLAGIQGGSVESGAALLQWDDDGSANQQWRLQKVKIDEKMYVKLINGGSGLAAAPKKGDVHIGTGLCQQADKDTTSELWEIVLISGDEKMLSL